MAVLTRDRLKPLLRAQSGPCVSIYMPTHRHYPGTQQDPIRFKNCLGEAERLLSDRHPPAQIRALLDPVASLPQDVFWRYQSDGLAVLRSFDTLEEFRVPAPVPELVVVAESFHVRPLIRFLNSNVRYFLVALSQGGVEVFEGSSTTLARVEIAGLPGGLADFTTSRRGKPSLSGHSSGGRSGARRIHSAGGAEASVKEDLLPYFRAIDRAVGRIVRHEPAPVILAGVEYYLPIYLEISRLKGLARMAVHGSPDSMSPEELHAGAWRIAQAILQESEERALERYRKAAHRGRTCDGLEDIAREASRGRIRRLFLAQDVRAWGTVDASTGRISRTATQQGSHDDDLFDDFAEAVLSHGGEVLTLPQSRMPEGKEVAAELAHS